MGINKRIVKGHLQQSAFLLADQIAELKLKIAELKLDVNMDNIGELVKLQIELMEKEEKYNRIHEELKNLIF